MMQKCTKPLNDALHLQSDFDIFCNWCTDNGMDLNFDKCSVITFSYKKNNLTINYNLFNCSLQRVSLVNDLDIFFTPN